MKEKLVKRNQPTWVAPMLAKLVKEPFSGKDWIFERKLDGVRCLVFSKNQKINMLSRNKLQLGETYPKIYKALTKYKDIDFIIDTEIVYDQGKLNSFAHLQKVNKENNGSKNIRMYIFDLLYINGYDLTKLALIKRKELLKKAFKVNKTICFTSYAKTIGLAFFKRVVSLGFEGMIAKKLNSSYSSKRSSNWLKIKSINRQEFVVCGYTKPSGDRKGFGALLLGFYKRNVLKYAGKVGTGFDATELKSLFVKLKQLKAAKCPFQNPPKLQAEWVKPKLVVECSFTEWTDDDKLRHPSYLGLRKDISTKKVRKE